MIVDQIDNTPPFRYFVSSRWCGWGGGWGSDEAIARHVDEIAAQGWRLVSAETGILLWLGFLPRPKVLFIFELERG